MFYVNMCCSSQMSRLSRLPVFLLIYEEGGLSHVTFGVECGLNGVLPKTVH